MNELTYGLGMLPQLFRNKFDVIHFSEFDLGYTLFKLRQMFRFRYKLLFSNGAPARPELYAPFDHIQEVNQVRLDDALSFGISPGRLSLVPYGIDCTRFKPVEAATKQEYRSRYQIPNDKFVVLTVAAIKRHHKRIDHLITELGSLKDKGVFLVVAGQETEETPALRELARNELGENFCFTQLPHQEVHRVFQLSDLFVLPSLTEGLPNVVLEAMACGLPCLVHNDPLFTWATQRPDYSVDMSATGKLAEHVQAISTSKAAGGLDLRQARLTSERFDWQSLAPKYLELYRSIASKQ